MRESKGSIDPDDRVWYDQFTSTDWVHDSIADAYRVKELRSRKDIRGRILAFFDGGQGWILSALVGFITAVIAYAVDISEEPVFDWKDGYCSKGLFISEKVCRVSTRDNRYKDFVTWLAMPRRPDACKPVDKFYKKGISFNRVLYLSNANVTTEVLP